ncbi:MAG TPA: hypothetical protein VFA04_03995, partial [Bryobacteraceae bacterium]|nr:hypothetical protein [Bryobacteraceae bacterium]
RTLVTSRTEVMSSLWVMQAVRPGRFGMARAITSVNSTWDGMDSLDWTPDDRILYSSLVSGSGDLWLIDAEGRNRRQITNMKARNHFGTASPDGRFILFGSMQGGGQNLWRVPTAGGEPRQISVGDSDMECRYSPDGRWIYYISISSGKRLLMRMPAEGGPAVRLSETPTYPWHFDVSPDGTRIAFLVFDPVKHGYRFAVIPSSGGSPVAFVDAPGPEDVRWTHDGTALMYVAAVDGSVNVWARPVDRGPAWKVTNFGEGSIFRFATSPDGRWLALARGQRLSDVVAIQRTE